MEKTEVVAGKRRDVRSRGGFIISGLTGGHGVFHWFSQSFLVMLPEVQAHFGLSEVGVGAIAATRSRPGPVLIIPSQGQQ